MIDIIDKADCVGCNACVSRCPTQCISMHADGQGFAYPRVDVARCINCGLCERVCPVIVQGKEQEPLKVVAAVNPDAEIRRKSSSGGVFNALARKIIGEGGVVFGARFAPDWSVVHDYAETIDGIGALMGAKYVQSEIGSAYINAEKFLKQGRKVLFSGTSCQIAGLKLFLRKDYGDLLLAVEVVCHGVPSPLVWKEYIAYRRKQAGDRPLTAISFRDKQYGWERYCLSFRFDGSRYIHNLNSDPYLSGFINDLYLRPSCFRCPAKCGRANSDVVLGDFWHIRDIQPADYHFNGVSLVLANSARGLEAIEQSGLNISESTYKKGLAANPAIVRSATVPQRYDSFWQSFGSHGIDGLKSVLKGLRMPLLRKLKMYLTYTAKRIFVLLGIDKK